MKPVKLCKRCGKTKALTKTYWHSNMTRPDGFATVCKDCKKDLHRKYVESGEFSIKAKARSERHREQNRKYNLNQKRRKEDPGFAEQQDKEKEKERQRKYHFRARHTLRDAYVCQRLKQEYGMCEIPDEIIRLQREIIKLKRIASKYGREKHESGC